jgi:hypothetical protein
MIGHGKPKPGGGWFHVGDWDDWDDCGSVGSQECSKMFKKK